MMKLRKTLAILIAAAMIFALAACSGDGADDSTPTPNSGFVPNTPAGGSDDDATTDGTVDENGNSDSNTDNSDNADGTTTPDANDADADVVVDNPNPNVTPDGDFIIAPLGNNRGVTEFELSNLMSDPWSSNPNSMVNVVLGAYLAEIVTYCPITGQPEWGKATYQSFGFPGLDDGKTLLSLGYAVIATRDRNGHGDTSRVVNGEPFFGERSITSGYSVFTVTTILHGGVQVHYNICIYAPDGAIIDGAPGTWNLREKHLLAPGHPFTRHTAAEFLELEARYGAPDPAMFAGYTASKDEVIDLMALHAELLANGDYISYNTSLANWG